MGAKGIRRRKPAHHLPPVADDVGAPDSHPPVMWPGAGSGFEADPFSPAGQVQSMWRFWDGIRWHRDRPASGPLRWLSWLVVIFVVVPMLAVLAYGLLRWL